MLNKFNKIFGGFKNNALLRTMNRQLIKRKIKAKGVTKTHLAKLLGVSSATLIMALNGKRKGKKYQTLLAELVKIL